MATRKRKVPENLSRDNPLMSMCEEAPKQTPTQRKIDAAYERGFQYGKQIENQRWEARQKDFEAQLKAAKGDQIVAVTALIKATTDNLSKCGYLINSLSKEKGW